MPADLLLLADGRLPAGGHAHSGGIEAAVRDAAVTDLLSLERFLEGRLATAGQADASVAAWVAAQVRAAAASADWSRLDAEAGARVPVPALRVVSRQRGRQLLRVARHAWPCDAVDALAAHAPPEGPHQVVVAGTVGAVAGLSPAQVAEAVAYDAVAAPASAAVRLLALDPLAVHAMLARLTRAIDVTAAAAARAAATGVPLMTSSPLLDLRAQRHATWEVTLFAS
jgi:urease accessory protein